jgi:hypothetical protein
MSKGKTERIFNKGAFIQTPPKRGETFSRDEHAALVKQVESLGLDPIWELILLSESISYLNQIFHGAPN